MSVSPKSLLILCLMINVCLLAACSESEPEDIGEPFPKADPVLRPYISNEGNLDNLRFNPSQTVTLGTTLPSQIEFDSETLIASEDYEFLVALDTDVASVISTNNDQYTQETTLPEYILYTQEQRVILFDFASRHHHELIDFSNTAEGVPDGTICDLRRVITLDNIAFERMEVILKNELAAYLVLSSTGDCTDPTAFLRMDIKESDKALATFNVEKTHLSQVSTIADAEGGESISNINDPVFDLELPQWLLEFAITLKQSEEANENPEIDYKALTPKTVNRTHTLKKYVATLQTTSSALVYADTPIIDQVNLRAGYLGLDVIENQLRFYEHDPATKRNTEIWQLNISAQENSLLHPEINRIERQSKLIGKESNPYRYYDSKRFVLIEAGWNIVKLSHDILFNDERQNERENSFSTPFFTRKPTPVFENADLDLDYETGSLAILDWQDRSIFYAKEGGTPLLVKRLNEANLLQANITTTLSQIYITKMYGNNAKVLTTATLPTRTLPSVETTFLASDPLIQWELEKIGGTVVLNMINTSTDKAMAYDLTTAGQTLSNAAALEDSIFIRIKDSRFFRDANEYLGLLFGEAAESGNNNWYLWNPRLYIYDPDATDGRGTAISIISSNLQLALSNTSLPNIPTLRIISEQAKADAIEKPLQLAPWAYRYRNFAQYNYRNVIDGAWHDVYDPQIDTGFFPAPAEIVDDGTTPIVTGPTKPKPSEND